MPVSRYKKTTQFLNDLPEHEELFVSRGVKSLNHHGTHELKQITRREVHQSVLEPHTWRQQDAFWKLAAKYYDDPEYWWIIAQFNQRPTEAHVTNGETILIPTPLRIALKILGY